MLDTNVLIGCLRRNNHLIEKIEQAGKAHDLAISSITFGELMVGIMRNDTPRRRSALKKVLAPMKILDFGQDAAAEFAKIKVSLQESGTPIGPYDMQIVPMPLAPIRRSSHTTFKNLKEFKISIC